MWAGDSRLNTHVKRKRSVVIYIGRRGSFHCREWRSALWLAQKGSPRMESIPWFQPRRCASPWGIWSVCTLPRNVPSPRVCDLETLPYTTRGHSRLVVVCIQALKHTVSILYNCNAVKYQQGVNPFLSTVFERETVVKHPCRHGSKQHIRYVIIFCANRS